MATNSTTAPFVHFDHATPLPLRFHVSEGIESDHLRQLIITGGGIVADNANDMDVIHVLPPGMCISKRNLGSAFYYQKWVTSSWIKRRVADTEAVAVKAVKKRRTADDEGLGEVQASLDKHSESLIFDVEPDASVPDEAFRTHGSSQVGEIRAAAGQARLKFTEEDNRAMQNWVADRPTYPDQGRKIWELAENAKVTAHSWQSMQNHWRRRLRKFPNDGQQSAQVERQESTPTEVFLKAAFKLGLVTTSPDTSLETDPHRLPPPRWLQGISNAHAAGG